MTGEFRIQGLEPVLRKMKALGQKQIKKAAGAALRRGAKLVVKAARNGLAGVDDPRTKSNISKAIASSTSARAGNRIGGVVVKVGVRGGARPRRGTEDEGHFRFVEFGKEGVPARPFLRPALANNIAPVTDAIVASLNTEIDKIIAKGGV